MTGQQLMQLLESEFPGARVERKPAPKPTPKRDLGPMCAQLPPKRVELPALGGSIEILYDWES